MKKINFLLNDDEYEELKDFLYSMMYCDLPIVNTYIVELVLGRIEESEQ